MRAILLIACGGGSTIALARRRGVLDGSSRRRAAPSRSAAPRSSSATASIDVVTTVLTEGDGHFRVIALPEGDTRVLAVARRIRRPPRSMATVAAGTVTDVRVDLPIAASPRPSKSMAPASIVSAARYARRRRVDRQQRTGAVRHRRRLGRRAAAARERHRSARRRQHQRRPSDAGRRADRRRARSSIRSTRPRPLHAARRRDRFGGGDAESVRGRVRPLLVGARGDSDAARRRRVERAAQQPRSRRSAPSATTTFNINGIGRLGAATSRPAARSSRTACSSSRRRSTATAATMCRAVPRRRAAASTHWFSSFTRVDANLSPRHSLVGTGGFFPSVTDVGLARHVHAARRDRRHPRRA